jgi:hypothetical protein
LRDRRGGQHYRLRGNVILAKWSDLPLPASLLDGAGKQLSASFLRCHSLTLVLHISLVSPQWMEHGSRRAMEVTARLPSRESPRADPPRRVGHVSAAGSGLSGGAKPAPPHRDADKYDLRQYSLPACRTRTPSQKAPCNNFHLIQYLKLYPKAESNAVSLRQHST